MHKNYLHLKWGFWLVRSFVCANVTSHILLGLTTVSLLIGPEHETPEADAGDAPPTPQKEATEGRESELKKQEMLVQYLKDTESFALQVERAIAVINNMLYWKTTTGNHQLNLHNLCNIQPFNCDYQL